MAPVDAPTRHSGAPPPKGSSMISNKHVCIERLVAWAVGAAAGAGCASSATIPVTSPATSVVRVAASERPFVPACKVDGSTRVLATKVSPTAGVEAEADSSRVVLRFSHAPNAKRSALTVDPDSLDAVEESDVRFPKLEHVADPGRIVLTGRPVSWEAGELRVDGPIVATVDSDRSVWAWTAGSIHSGLDVRVLTVGAHGQPLSIPVTLAHGGSAIGLPSVALTSSGRGVIAFLDSSERGFRLVAASVDCTGAPRDAPSPWAMRVAR
jgi:hypothetical protein